MSPSDDVDALDVTLEAAALLHESGQSTAMTLVAVQRLNRGLGQSATLIVGWSGVALYGGEPHNPIRMRATSPVGLNMRRVAAVMRVVDAAQDGPLQPAVVADAVAEARRLPPSSSAAFVIACAAGAAALSIIYGANDSRIIGLIAAAAAAGAVARRAIGRFGGSPLLQLLVAAVIAGVAGGVASTAHLGAASALVALCPAMVLVPGPQTLLAAMDLLALRMSMGIARLGHATLALMTIGAGLVIGSGLAGQDLPPSPMHAHVPFLADVLAAGVAASCYSVFFSVPYRLIGWPVAAGMAAHGLHWWLTTAWDLSLPAAAGLCCLLVGATLVPVSYRHRIPFVGIGFAAVVAMVPGVYVFEVVAGLARIPTAASPALLTDIAANAVLSALVVVSMGVGLIVCTQIRDAVLSRSDRC